MDIRDIARLSGYSLGTVSRVINGKPHVSQKARDRVMQVVREQGFEPNLNARNLRQAARSSVGVFVKGTRNHLFARIVECLHERLMAADEQMQLIYLDEDANEVAEAVRYQRTLHFKGIFFLGGDPENFRTGFADIDVPCVLLTNSAESLGFQNLSSFTTDDNRAAGEVIDLLVKAGHRAIGVVGGHRAGEQAGEMRLQGALASLKDHGVEFDLEHDHEPSRFSMEDGCEATKRLLERRPDLTAVFALGDVIAIGAMRGLSDLGKSVPRQVSLVGFDGLEAGSYTVPRLTTVCQDAPELARRGAEAMLERIERPELGPVHDTVAHDIRVGESISLPLLAS